MAGFLEHRPHRLGHGIGLERQSMQVLAAERFAVTLAARHVTLERVDIAPARIDHGFAAGIRVRLALPVEPASVPTEGVNGDGLALPLQTLIKVERDSRSPG